MSNEVQQYEGLGSGAFDVGLQAPDLSSAASDAKQPIDTPPAAQRPQFTWITPRLVDVGSIVRQQLRLEEAVCDRLRTNL